MKIVIADIFLKNTVFSGKIPRPEDKKISDLAAQVGEHSEEYFIVALVKNGVVLCQSNREFTRTTMERILRMMELEDERGE